MVSDRERFTLLKNKLNQFKIKLYKIFETKKLNYQRRKTIGFFILT